MPGRAALHMPGACTGKTEVKHQTRAPHGLKVPHGADGEGAEGLYIRGDLSIDGSEGYPEGASLHIEGQVVDVPMEAGVLVASMLHVHCILHENHLG